MLADINKTHPFTLLTLYSLTFFLAGSLTGKAAPEWIWLGSEPKDDQTVYFRKMFDAPESLESATLYGACDNQLTAFVNGERVLSNDTWKNQDKADVTSLVRGEDNVIAVKGQNKSGAAGLLMHLVIEHNQNGEEEKQIIASNTSWQVTDQVSGDEWTRIEKTGDRWTDAHSFGKLGVDPWGAISSGESVSAEDLPLTAPDGFEVERVYNVPDHQGSWASMTFDPEGRIIASGEFGSLYCLKQVQSGDGEIQADPIDVRVSAPGKEGTKSIGAAQGLTWAFDSLYVVVNGNRGKAFGSGLYRLRDRNGDGKLDSGKLLESFDERGAHGHGPHAVVKGPEGNTLYVLNGNHVAPVDFDSSMQPPVWREDVLLPRIPPPSGHAANITAPGGSLYRTDPEGTHWELVANGMRNAYDLDFNRHGEAFTFDADMEYDIGLPWYRPTRVTHIPGGAEFGWRNGSGKWPSYFPDSIPPTVNLGRTSPTGVTFGYGSDFPKPFRNALFVGDWSLGRIFAVHLTPDGASYTGTTEEFITGKPLPVTDMEVGPDGAMYFITGGRNMDSSLYRVTYTGSSSGSNDSRDISAEKQNDAKKARALRKRLEQLHSADESLTEEQLEFAWKHLSSADRFIRYAARIAVENASVDRWRNRALNETDPQTLILAQLALARHGEEEDRPDMISALTNLKWNTLSLQQKRSLLRVYGVMFNRMGRPGSDGSRQAVLNQLNPHYPANESTLNRELSRVLVYLNAAGVIEKTLGLLETATDQTEEIHYGYVLRTVEDGWTVEQRRTLLSWLNRALGYGGGHRFHEYLGEIKKRVVNKMDDDVKDELRSVIEGNEEKDQVQTRSEMVKNWRMKDLLPAVQATLKNRDFERGKRMFHVAQCAQCHQFNGKGGITGPDLTSVGQRFDREYILESIIKPSKVISNRYSQSMIKKKDGSVVVGKIVNLWDSRIRVRPNPMDPSQIVHVDRSDIASIETSDASPMPPGLLNTLQKEEILDLFAYLLSGGDSDHRMFPDK